MSSDMRVNGIRRMLRKKKKGTFIGSYDLLIAGLAVILVTNNVREVERIEGLIVENWV